MAAPPLAAADFASVLAPQQLEEAWLHVVERDERDGTVSPSVRRFAEDPSSGLAQLHTELMEDRYRPRPLSPLKIPKEDGSTRELRIPAARDRVVERALTVWLTPRLDPWMSPASFGYRPGLGPTDAVRRVVWWREMGFDWAVRVDVDDCFPTIDRQRVLARLERHLDDLRLRHLIQQLIERPVRRDGSVRPTAMGLAQGGSLSPLLANLALTPFDRRLARRGVVHVRFADDTGAAFGAGWACRPGRPGRLGRV